MKSIYSKLIIGYFVSVLFSFSAAGFFSIRKNYEDISKLAKDELTANVDHIAQLISLVDDVHTCEILEKYASSSDLSFCIYADDQVIYYGCNQEEGTFDMLTTVEKKYVINDKSYIINASKDITKRTNIFLDSVMIAVLCMLLTGSITFLMIADIIVKPISRLNKATIELAKGNYRVRVNYTGDDEIARLNRSFNQMAIQLGKQEEIRQQFISDVSHEFQTPLTAIQGFATILKNDELPKEMKDRYIDIILFHTKRLSSLSKNMLQLTLLEGEDFKLDVSEFSLVKQMNRVIETQDNLALSKDIEIEFQIPKNDIVVFADEARLEQVWTNLINNAIKYTPEHGVVTIEMKKTSKQFEVSIQDTGVGMSKEAISHIFERFYRQDKSRSVEGNGLGLSIVKRIVDLHYGTIDVTSIVDGGSTFTVKIPQERIHFLSNFNKK